MRSTDLDIQLCTEKEHEIGNGGDEEVMITGAWNCSILLRICCAQRHVIVGGNQSCC